ncbi:MAG: nonstructural protein [Microvirus sp.]|nr:MAG: nonstructural protein [Microvirus sp.]
MILKAFALLDTKVGEFHTPFFLATDAAAKRACIDIGSDPSTMVGRHPADFMLYEIGEYDSSRAALEPRAPISHGLVLSMLPPKTRSFEEWQQDQLAEPHAIAKANGYHPAVKEA